MWWRYHPPKPTVAERRSQAEKAGRTLAQQGRKLTPVKIQGSKIAQSVWGRAWCDHIESYHDQENRLPRGRSYVRNGSVIHLALEKGRIEALVSGTEVYTVKIEIAALDKARWSQVKGRSAGQIGSLIELLEGRLSEPVMRIMTDRDQGIFPRSKEIKLSCSCPDSATMCKHVAAVLYGVGARLDEEPHLLFLLRHVDHAELITGVADQPARSTTRRTLASEDLEDVFGIELAEDDAPQPPHKTSSRVKRAKKAVRQSTPKRKAAVKKAAAKKAPARKK